MTAATDPTHAYLGYRDGKAVMIFVDDGSKEMRAAVAKHLKLQGATIERMPVDQARDTFVKAIEARKAAR